MRPNPARLLPAVLASLVLAAGLAACGDDEAGSGAGAASAPAAASQTTAEAAPGGEIDAAFIRQMIPHHRGAVEMARTAQQQAEHAEIKKLAAEIITAQQRELRQLDQLAADLGVDLAGSDAAMPADAATLGLTEAQLGMSMQHGGLDDADPFDLAFIDEMITHHKGALAMAQVQSRNGEDPRVKELADAIIQAQQREITTMGGWRNAWYPTAPAREPGGSGAHMDHGK